MFPRLGRDLLVAEEFAALGDVLPRRLAPRLGVRRALDHPPHPLGDPLLRPAALVVPEGALEADEGVTLRARKPRADRQHRNHQPVGVPHVLLGRVLVHRDVGTIDHRCPGVALPLLPGSGLVLQVPCLEVVGQLADVNTLGLEPFVQAIDDPVVAAAERFVEQPGVGEESDRRGEHLGRFVVLGPRVERVDEVAIGGDPVVGEAEQVFGWRVVDGARREEPHPELERAGERGLNAEVLRDDGVVERVEHGHPFAQHLPLLRAPAPPVGLQARREVDLARVKGRWHSRYRCNAAVLPRPPHLLLERAEPRVAGKDELSAMNLESPLGRRA